MEVKKSVVAVYDNHDKAHKAIAYLKHHDVDISKVSLLGKAEIVEDHLKVVPIRKVKTAPVSIGAVLGGTLGLLAGASIVAIPGLGLIYGAGAVVGALSGITAGLFGGELASFLLSIGIRKDKLVLYKSHLEAGKFLVIFHNATDEEVDKARQLLHTEGQHLEDVELND